MISAFWSAGTSVHWAGNGHNLLVFFLGVLQLGIGQLENIKNIALFIQLFHGKNLKKNSKHKFRWTSSSKKTFRIISKSSDLVRQKLWLTERNVCAQFDTCRSYTLSCLAACLWAGGCTAHSSVQSEVDSGQSEPVLPYRPHSCEYLLGNKNIYFAKSLI